jgi:translocation and assembly module TamB
LRKRTAAVISVLVVVGLVLATLLGLRTRWAGDRICRLVAARVEAATGLPLALGACRIDPLGLSVDAEGVILGPPSAPLFTAEALSAKLAAVQTLGRQLHLDRLRLVRPRLAAVIPAGAGQARGPCPPPFLAGFEIRRLEVEDGAVDLALPGGARVSMARIDVTSRPPARTLRALAVPTRRARLAASAGPIRVEAAGRSWTASRAAAEAEVALDLSWAEIASAEAEVAGARLELAGRVEDVCDPRLDLTARAEGPVRALLALAAVRSDVIGTASVEAHLGGRPRAPEVRASVHARGVRVGQFVPGDADAELRLEGRTLVVEKLSMPAEGGVAVAHGTIQLTRGLPVAAEVRSDGVDLAEILDRLGVTGPWVTLRLDGGARVAGTLSPPQLSGTLAVDVRDFKVLTRSYKLGSGGLPVLAFPHGRVETPVRVTGEGLFLDGARATVGRGAVEADAAVHFSSAGGFWVRCRGDVDLDALGPLVGIPWAGRSAVEATIHAAPYGNPLVTGRARAEGLHFLQVDLGNVATDFRYQDFLLHLENAQGARNTARYQGEVVVDLSRSPTQVVSSRFEGRGRMRDMFDAVMEWLPRTRYLRDVMDGDVEVRGTASGPADALDSTFEARLGAGTLLGRAFDSGRTEGRILAGRTARFDSAELRLGAGAVRMQGSWGVDPPFPWDLDVTFAGVPLAALDFPGGAWTGSASGSATLSGSYERPRVRFAANGAAVTVGGVPLGTVQAGGTLVDRRLVLTAGAEGIDLSAEVQLEGRLPFTARASLALEDAGRLMPGGPTGGLRARAVGRASAEGELEDLPHARGAIELSQLALSVADVKVEAAGPAEVLLRAGWLELRPLVLRGQSTELTLAGSAAPGGTVDVNASGGVDLRLVGALVPALRRAHGQLALEAHVGGTTEEPLLVGSGRVSDGGFQLRGTNVSFSGVSGALSFSKSRVLFDGLTAVVNGGRATFKGEVELARLAPARLRVEAALEEVPLAVPAYLPATLTGRVEAAGTPDATTVTGRLHVVRARYTADVNLEGSLLELRRRPPPPPRAYDRAGEWLRFDLQLVVDGDARVENDLVRGAVSGELTLTGTLASPGLLGTLAMGPGSRAAFRGNEFNLSQAVLELTDRNRIAISLDVHGESQVRDYQVFMHAFGPLETPQLTLTSVPPLPQPDIVTLLSLGFTRRDAAAGTGVGGVATAAAAQALLSSSGLDEQVRRFLPRGGPIRDLSMRITSAYSEQTGQVEPRAEFESWLLRDRLRLRFQAPLAGARGRTAQAEVRLGERTALQYQWDSDNPDVSTGDHGVDLKIRWEWNDAR